MEDRSSEISIFSSIVRDIGMDHTSLPEATITGFLAMVGHLYRGELMVIGRSVNGWTKRGWKPTSLKNEKTSSEFIKEIVNTVTEPSPSGAFCPMCWVSDCWGNYDYDYNTRRSAFWRVIRRTVSDLHIADTEVTSWPSHIVWSNLYKMAPSEGGNPSNALCSIQFQHCRNLLLSEITKFSPKRLLFLTGDWAWPFVGDIISESGPVDHCHYVEGAGTITIGDNVKSKTVIAEHPQGKKESVWVDEVVKMLLR
jgi:hypothetical protein